MTNSELHSLRPIRHLIVALMSSEGRDFNRCEQCLEGIPEGLYEIHHTRYEGATYQDLQIVCRSCNRLSVNLGLS